MGFDAPPPAADEPSPLVPDQQAAAAAGASIDIEVVDQFADKRWRMSNLYYILDELNREVKFVPNEMQVKFWNEMWYLNLILKGRQHGFCFSPSTHVLTSKLRWVKIGDLRAGDSLVAVDENGGDMDRGVRDRRMRSAIVQGLREVERQAYRVCFDDGRVLVLSGKHPLLSKKAGDESDWRSIENDTKKKLTVGTKVRWITKPWGEQTVEDGWVAGLIDGEGSLGHGPNHSGAQLGVSQQAGPVLERLRDYLIRGGYSYQEYVDRRTRAFGKYDRHTPVHRLEIARMDELFRLLGQTRPTRFIGTKWWEGKGLPGKRSGVGWAKIIKIEKLGIETLIDLQTSTGTYIAEGFVSHNTTFIDLFILDECIWHPGQVGGIIAHSLEDVRKIFRRKIKYPYDKLPEAIRAANPATNDSAQELVFANKSEISVGTGMRSGTLSYLHVSEYGIISHKYPEKAEEIQTGSFNTVHPGSYIFVESTGYGKGGKFAEMVKNAKNNQRSKKPLSKLDFKYHFYAWWLNKKYRLPIEEARFVVFTREQNVYFTKIERMCGITLDIEQRAWYVKKKEWNGELMFREYPSNDKEPFDAVIRGAIFGTQMAKAREEGRITKVPHDPGLGVDTWWDLGLRNKMAIWFVQQFGMQFRMIYYHEIENESLEWHIRLLAQLKDERKWHYRHHIGPHDLAVRDLFTKKSRFENSKRSGLHFIVGEQWPQGDQVEAGHNLIPMCVFDEENCEVGITHLENFRYEWNENLQTYMNDWRHDEHSHCASALMLGAMIGGMAGHGSTKARAILNSQFAT